MRRIPLLILSLLAVSGCDRIVGKADDSPILARANGAAITQREVDLALQRGGLQKDAGKQMLESLIDQQILASAAQDDKLDQNPGVRDALEAARKQVLAQAYLEKRMAGQGKATDQQVEDYFKQHASIFGQRRVYAFHSLTVVNAKPGLEQELRSEIDAGKGMNEVAASLGAAGYRFSSASGTAGAEQLPAYLPDLLSKAEPGQTVVAGSGNTLTVMNVLDAKPRPLSLDEAKPVIRRYLEGSARAQLAKQLLQDMRRTAKIEYSSGGTSDSIMTTAPK